MATTPRRLRADAARNRAKLLESADAVFAEHGLDAPLEEIARRAAVSIGTLYNHFPTRETFFDAIYPDRVAALTTLARNALDATDPWDGFAGYLTGLCALQAEDRGLNEALTGRHPDATELEAACAAGFADVARIVDRAKQDGSLRTDFALSDLAVLITAMSRVVDETRSTPDLWRRTLGFWLDGLRSGAARPLPVPPVTTEELTAALRRTGGTAAPTGS